jgi:predicted acyltransferase (DUF342 family)
MAQIIKHRRGSISSLKGTTARNGELIIASGSISDLSGPFVFIGSPNIGDEGVAGAFRSVSKIYQGTSAPTITAGTYGSILDGTPFYSTGNESLYILNNDGAGGNTRIDLTGNIEGNLISGVTINNITGSTANITNISGSFTGSGQGLYNIPASGITGLELNRISSGLATASISQADGLRVNTKTEITGSLTVSGNTYTIGDVSITGNTSQTGSIDLTGDIVLGGNITIGNQTTDIIQFGGEVSSSILPILHNSFDLGSSNKNWRNLHVSGTAYIDTLEAQQVNFNDLGVLTDLIVSGSTYLGNGGDITVISGSIYNDQLTEKRLVVVGAQGLLTDYSGITFDNGNLNVSGAIEVTNIQGTGSLYLKPNQADARYFEIYNTGASDTHIKSSNGLSFFGDDTNYLKVDDYLQTVTITGVNGVSISTSLNVTGSQTISNDLTITEDLIVSGNVYLGDMSMDSTIVSGTLYTHNTTYLGDMNTVFGDALIVSGGVKLRGSQTISDDLIVSGNVYFGDMSMDSTIISGTLYTHNTTHLGDMNTVFGDALIVSGGVKVRGSQTISDDLIVSGNVYFGDMSMDSTIISGTLYTHNTTNIGDMNTLFGTALIVSGAIKQVGDNDINGNLIVSGNVALGDSIGDSTIVSGTLYTHNTTYVGDMNTLFGTALIISGAVKQVGDSDINGNVTMTGSLTNSGSLNISGGASVTGAFTVGSGSMTSLGGDLYVSGNLEVLGSSTSVNLQSTTVNIGDNIILVNAYSPFQRYAGISGYDSGSIGTSGSLLWDSQNDYWMLVSGSGESSKVIGTTAGTYGSEVNLTSGTFPIATSTNTIGDSLLTYSGTTLSYNTNKFTIDSGTGDTTITGNLTLSYSGGTDNGNKTSMITFKNSNNVLGFVSTTETTDVLDGILGYKQSGGGLVFSTVIDGGSY